MSQQPGLDDAAPAEAATAASGLRRIRSAAQRLLFEPRLRGELGWLAGAKVAELVLVLATTKLLTNLMQPAEFGLLGLVQSGEMLVAFLLTMNMSEAYRRYYHTAEERSEQRATVRVLVRWFATVTLGAALLAAVLSAPLSGPLGLGAWTLLAGALLFAANRWRLLFTEIRDVQRERRVAMLYHSGCLVAQFVLVGLMVRFVSNSATGAVLGYAGASALFALLGLPPLLRSIAARGGGPVSGLPQMFWTFCLPYTGLKLCEWVQSTSDRFMLAYLLDTESVAFYNSMYQITGAPFVTLAGLLHGFMLPIAYQRARDIGDPRQLWSADKAVLGANLGYVAVSAAALLLLALLGPWLIVLFTNEHYAQPAWIVVTVSLARFLQGWAILIQSVFTVHQWMLPSTVFRAVGAILTVPISWWSIKYYGIGGAAVGAAVAAALYNLLLVLGPGGCFWLIRGNRARAAARAGGGRST